MKVQFLACAYSPASYALGVESVNGLDLSIVDEGGLFVGSDSTRAAGIRDAWRDSEGVLHVVLEQSTPVTKHTWRTSGGRLQTLPAVEPAPAGAQLVAEHREGAWSASAWIAADRVFPGRLYIHEVVDE